MIRESDYYVNGIFCEGLYLQAIEAEKRRQAKVRVPMTEEEIKDLLKDLLTFNDTNDDEIMV